MSVASYAVTFDFEDVTSKVKVDRREDLNRYFRRFFL